MARRGLGDIGIENWLDRRSHSRKDEEIRKYGLTEVDHPGGQSELEAMCAGSRYFPIGELCASGRDAPRSPGLAM